MLSSPPPHPLKISVYFTAKERLKTKNNIIIIIFIIILLNRCAGSTMATVCIGRPIAIQHTLS
jgi:hypothetical protein